MQEGDMNPKLQRQQTQVIRKLAATRADIMQNLKIPVSSDYMVVIPSHLNGHSFEQNCYKEETLRNIMTQQEFNETIKRFNKILGKSFTLKRKYDNRDISDLMKGFMGFGSALFIAGMVALYKGIIERSSTLQLIALLLIILSAVFLLAPYISYCKNRVSRFPSYQEIVQNELNKYISELNEQILHRGLYWSVIPGYYWIELHVNPQHFKQNINNIYEKQNLMMSFKEKIANRQSRIETQRLSVGKRTQVFLVENPSPLRRDMQMINEEEKTDHFDDSFCSSDVKIDKRDDFDHFEQQLSGGRFNGSIVTIRNSKPVKRQNLETSAMTQETARQQREYDVSQQNTFRHLLEGDNTERNYQYEHDDQNQNYDQDQDEQIINEEMLTQERFVEQEKNDYDQDVRRFQDNKSLFQTQIRNPKNLNSVNY